ncbi:hypothetical protein K6U19_08425 [Vibrio fluvialis]|uniref:hypothetical protein n=1 Tax=Vibrio fluvialis TaxID=676 RepID=UPI000509A03C|nr:hypothetical protein [Vibrio fluvialis]EKO3486860.1 hypothetical protein [Vibrio fluvialis]EKO3966265.1 hypothetical protein [Vibrio fluvialis]EKO3992576.1 hypothetical protein [Vibrio fluvialis]MBY8150858.1 hypothetical protein [Vibrio fluvialis]MCG6341269.1 hypothetical protein [Vibrio fluvialis]
MLISCRNVNKVITFSFEPFLESKPFPLVKEKQTQKVRSLVTKLRATKVGSEVAIALIDMITVVLEKHETPLMASTVFMRMRLHPEVRELIDRSLQPSNIELNRLRHLVVTTVGGMLSHKNQRKYKRRISKAASSFYSNPDHQHVRLGCFAKGMKDLASEGLFPDINFVARMSEKTIKKYASEHTTEFAKSRGRNGAKELRQVKEFLKQHFAAKK